MRASLGAWLDFLVQSSDPLVQQIRDYLQQEKGAGHRPLPGVGRSADRSVCHGAAGGPPATAFKLFLTPFSPSLIRADMLVSVEGKAVLLESKGLDQDQPIPGNDTEAKRPENRQVELAKL